MTKWHDRLALNFSLYFCLLPLFPFPPLTSKSSLELLVSVPKPSPCGMLEVFIWRSRFIWRSGFICGGRDKIVFLQETNSVECGIWWHSVYNMSKPCRLTRCNVEAYERTKANTCHPLYPVINQWSEETPFLSILRLKLCYSFSLKVNPRPLTLPTALSLELAKSCQQVIFSLQLVSPIDDFSQEVRTDSLTLAFLNWPNLASRSHFFLHLSWLKLTWSI